MISMPKYQIRIYKQTFGEPRYIDDDEVSCKTKAEANKYAKKILEYHKGKGTYGTLTYKVYKK